MLNNIIVLLNNFIFLIAEKIQILLQYVLERKSQFCLGLRKAHYESRFQLLRQLNNEQILIPSYDEWLDYIQKEKPPKNLSKDDGTYLLHLIRKTQIMLTEMKSNTYFRHLLNSFWYERCSYYSNEYVRLIEKIQSSDKSLFKILNLCSKSNEFFILPLFQLMEE